MAVSKINARMKITMRGSITRYAGLLTEVPYTFLDDKGYTNGFRAVYPDCTSDSLILQRVVRHRLLLPDTLCELSYNLVRGRR